MPLFEASYQVAFMLYGAGLAPTEPLKPHSTYPFRGGDMVPTPCFPNLSHTMFLVASSKARSPE